MFLRRIQSLNGLSWDKAYHSMHGHLADQEQEYSNGIHINYKCSHLDFAYITDLNVLILQTYNYCCDGRYYKA